MVEFDNLSTIKTIFLMENKLIFFMKTIILVQLQYKLCKILDTLTSPYEKNTKQTYCSNIYYLYITAL